MIGHSQLVATALGEGWVVRRSRKLNFEIYLPDTVDHKFVKVLLIVSGSDIIALSLLQALANAIYSL